MEIQNTTLETNEKNKRSHIPVIITSIEEMKDAVRWDGYIIKMSDPTKNITCKISNQQSCCEDFGVHCKNTNLQDFIGAEYLSVKIDDKENKIFPEEDFGEQYIVISIQTNIGTIDFILYNNHNGYYSHEYYIKTEFEENNGEF